MSRDSGSEEPGRRTTAGQRTVAELIAQYGGDAAGGGRRRRRRAEEPSTTAPQEIIERVTSETDPSRKLPSGPVPADSRPPGSGPADAEPSEPRPPDEVPLGAGPARPPGPAPAARGGPRPPVAPPGTPAEPSGRGARDPWSLRFTTAEPSGAAPVPMAMPGGESMPLRNRESVIQPPMRPKPQFPRRATGPGVPRIPEIPTADPPAPETERGRRRTEYEPATEELHPVGRPQAFDAAMPTTVIPPAAEPEDQPADPDHQADPQYRDDGDFSDSEDPESERSPVLAEPEPDEDDEEPRTARQWLMLALQMTAGVVGGGGLWLGFRVLWLSIPVAAVAAAVVVTGCLVFIARRSASTSDTQTIVLAAVVGLVCTVSPVAVVLVGQ